MFILGLIVGIYVGFFYASLCAVSAKTDRKER